MPKKGKKGVIYGYFAIDSKIAIRILNKYKNGKLSKRETINQIYQNTIIQENNGNKYV